MTATRSVVKAEECNARILFLSGSLCSRTGDGVEQFSWMSRRDGSVVVDAVMPHACLGSLGACLVAPLATDLFFLDAPKAESPNINVGSGTGAL